jgi:lysophospholipase L1-like esterase
MPTINVQSKEMQNGDVVLSYSNTVGPQSETFTFTTPQETVILFNKGSKGITYNLGGQSGTLFPSQSVKVTGSIESLSLSSEGGTQHFEIWAEEAGTKGGSDQAVAGLDAKVTALQSSVAQKAPFSSAAYPVLQKLYHNNGNVNVVIIGDSTGNESWEWVYLFAQKLGIQFPTHTVKYYLWEDTSLSYGAGITIQTGTGSNILNIYNASVAGKTIYYPIQYGFVSQVITPNPDLVIISHGHNEGNLSVDVEKWNNKTRYYLLGQYVAQMVPNSAIMLIAQNPQVGSQVQKLRAQMISEVAIRCGYGFINVHDVFLSKPNWGTTLMLDSVHPNAEGAKVWIEEVMKHFKSFPELQPIVQVPSSFSSRADNLLTNGDFTNFSSAIPDSWSALLSPTLSKDTTKFETGTYGLKIVTAPSVQGAIYQNVHLTNPNIPINFYKGKTITFAVRLRKPQGQPATAGRLALYDGLVTNTSRTSYESDGNFYWDCISLKVSNDATMIRAYIYGDTSSTGNIEVTVDRAILVFGELPKDLF